MFTRKQQECICPRGQTKGHRIDGVSMAGDPNGRVGTTKGCPEHDACHHWTAENRAKYAVGREGWSIGPWCPIHEKRDCPSTGEAEQKQAGELVMPPVTSAQTIARRAKVKARNLKRG